MSSSPRDLHLRRGAPRTVHEPLDSHGSRCSAVALTERPISEMLRCPLAQPLGPIYCCRGPLWTLTRACSGGRAGSARCGLLHGTAVALRGKERGADHGGGRAGHVSPQHQSFLHFVGQGDGSDAKVLEKVLERVPPSIDRAGRSKPRSSTTLNFQSTANTPRRSARDQQIVSSDSQQSPRCRLKRTNSRQLKAA